MKLVKSLASIAVVVSSVAMADPRDPQVSKVTVSQDASRVVNVSYHLDEAAIVTLDVLTNGVSIGGENINHVTGDCNKKVAAGDRTLQWRAHKSWPGQRFDTPVVSVKVTAWAVDTPPEYMICNLVDGSIRYFTETNFFPDGDLSSDVYRDQKMVFKRIHAANVEWTMGAASADEGSGEGSADGNTGNMYVLAKPAHPVVLTKDYYLAIFQVTRAQLLRFHGSLMPSDSTADAERYEPAGRVPYDVIRGTTEGAKWPASAGVDSGSLVAKFRAIFSNVYAFDLPTEAQWEFACRGGTTTEYWRMPWEASGEDVYYGRGRVGIYPPNPFGLYGMSDGLRDWCLDWAAQYSSSDEQTDPKGPSTGITRVRRGGGISGNGMFTYKSWCRLAGDLSDKGTNEWKPRNGFRFCLTID